MDSPIRIIVADDHALFRQGLKSLFKLRQDIQIVGEVERAADLSAALAQTPCDVLLLDLGMERSSLIDIEALSKQVHVVVVTASEQSEDAADAIRAGACAVVIKRFTVETLMEAIHAAADGQIRMPPALQAYLATSLRQAERDPLTRREREVIRYVSLGLRNAEVARKLYISEQTVKRHLNNVFHKLGVRDRVELTLYAARVGIVGIHESPT